MLFLPTDNVPGFVRAALILQTRGPFDSGVRYTRSAVELSVL